MSFYLLSSLKIWSFKLSNLYVLTMVLINQALFYIFELHCDPLPQIYYTPESLAFLFLGPPSLLWLERPYLLSSLPAPFFQMVFKGLAPSALLRLYSIHLLTQNITYSERSCLTPNLLSHFLLISNPNG